jgi:hypothetical protein
MTSKEEREGLSIVDTVALATRNTNIRTAKRLSQRLCTGFRTPPPREAGSYATTWLRPVVAPVGPTNPERWAPILPRSSDPWRLPLAPPPVLLRGFVLVVATFALPPREAGNHAAMWPCPMVAPTDPTSPERWVPILPRSSGSWRLPPVLPPREVGSCACDGSLGSTSMRGRLPCCHMAPCPWCFP